MCLVPREMEAALVRRREKETQSKKPSTRENGERKTSLRFRHPTIRTGMRANGMGEKGGGGGVQSGSKDQVENMAC